MKVRFFYISLGFVLFIWLCGCGDAVVSPGQVAELLAASEAGVLDVPAEVWSAMALQSEKQARLNRNRVETLKEGSDFFALYQAFYTKYIDAEGIAIVAPDSVEDKFLVCARDLVVVMTSKRPELRERFLSKHGKFYLVLVRYPEKLADMPENRLSGFVLNFEGPKTERRYPAIPNSCYHNSATHIEGYCYAHVPSRRGPLLPVRILANEFAHALHLEMARLDPGFEEKIRQANAAVGGAAWAYPENWADMVSDWFHLDPLPGKNRHEDFLKGELGPFAEILDEWFPRVYYILKYKSDTSIWGGPMTFLSGTWVSADEYTFEDTVENPKKRQFTGEFAAEKAEIQHELDSSTENNLGIFGFHKGKPRLKEAGRFFTTDADKVP